MVNMTLSIPKEVHALMKKHSDIRWSEVARKAIIKKVETVEFMDKLVKGSKLTEEDSIILGKKINKSLSKKYNIK
jgi:hypothetical protein